jgi:hypothetical protein
MNDTKPRWVQKLRARSLSEDAEELEQLLVLIAHYKKDSYSSRRARFMRTR